jgi:voltage-gated potassium channel
MFQFLNKHLIAGFSLLILILLFGSFGYKLIEGMSFFEGFYMTFITITTIGFGEVHQLSSYGRLLTIIISVMGIGVLAFIATNSTQVILEAIFFKDRLLKNRIKKMENHYIICGYGRIGRRIVEELLAMDLSVVVVENNDATIEILSKANISYIRGNAQKEEMLEDAGISRARALICTLSRDEDNVFVTLVARELNPELFILVRTNHLHNSRKILRAGADKVISPYDIGADRMAKVILKPHVDMFLDRLTKGDSEDNAFDEIMITEKSLYLDKTLGEINLRQKYDILIVAVIPNDNPDKFIFNPGAAYRFHVGDILIALGQASQIKAIRVEIGNDNRTQSERNDAIDKFLKHLRKNSSGI